MYAEREYVTRNRHPPEKSPRGGVPPPSLPDPTPFLFCKGRGHPPLFHAANHHFPCTSGVRLNPAGKKARRGSPPSKIIGTPLPPDHFFRAWNPSPCLTQREGGLPPLPSSIITCISTETSDERARGPSPTFENGGGWPPVKKGGGTPRASGILATPLPPAHFFRAGDPTPLITQKGGGAGSTQKETPAFVNVGDPSLIMRWDRVTGQKREEIWPLIMQMLLRLPCCCRTTGWGSRSG
jgi:hypothetical protein